MRPSPRCRIVRYCQKLKSSGGRVLLLVTIHDLCSPSRSSCSAKLPPAHAVPLPSAAAALCSCRPHHRQPQLKHFLPQQLLCNSCIFTVATLSTPLCCYCCPQQAASAHWWVDLAATILLASACSRRRTCDGLTLHSTHPAQQQHSTIQHTQGALHLQ
jgi:hypothetical protein